VEKKISKELLKENDYFFIKPGDGPVKRDLKAFLNSFRWFAYYLQLLFFVFMSLVLVLLGLFAG